MSDQVDVLLYGLGASNYEAVKSNGITINSEIHGSHSFRPFNVVKAPSEAPGHYDYVVCSHKAIDQDSVPEIIAPVVDDDTTLVIIQNGVGNEEPFRDFFPESSILTCVTWVGANQSSPGIIEHNKNEDLQIGLYPNPHLYPALEKHRLDNFASILSSGKTIFQVKDNMQLLRWEKVVWNAAWNSLTTLTNIDTQTWLHSSDAAIKLSRQIMREVIEVGKRSGIPLRDELVDELMEKIGKMPGIGSSMQMDCRNRRRLEVDVILGVPVRRGRELGVEIPTLEVVYAMVLGIDFGVREGRV